MYDDAFSEWTVLLCPPFPLSPSFFLSGCLSVRMYLCIYIMCLPQLRDPEGEHYIAMLAFFPIHTILCTIHASHHHEAKIISLILPLFIH